MSVASKCIGWPNHGCKQFDNEWMNRPNRDCWIFDHGHWSRSSPCGCMLVATWEYVWCVAKYSISPKLAWGCTVCNDVNALFSRCIVLAKLLCNHIQKFTTCLLPLAFHSFDDFEITGCDATLCLLYKHIPIIVILNAVRATLIHTVAIAIEN